MAVAGARPKTFPQASIEQHAARIEISPRAFSLVRYAPAAVLIAVLLADSNRHTDPDLWGHLRFGQAFIAGRHLLHRDTYSYSAAGHRWRDHEWLAEVVMAFVYNAAGVAGLKLWKFACTAAALLFVADTEAVRLAGGPGPAATICGVSRQTIYDWINERRVERLIDALRLSRASGVAIENLAGDDVEKLAAPVQTPRLKRRAKKTLADSPGL